MNTQSNRSHLPRLPKEYYLGKAYVHWTMGIEHRKTGWLVPNFYYRFREILTHAMFRYGIACPIYCLMPDHMHLLWIGMHEGTDQRSGVQFFRKHINQLLKANHFEFQRQAFDHVLREEERERDAFETVAEYIAQNPQRAGLVSDFRSYKFTGCLVPGYPEMSPWMETYWDRFWRAYSYLGK
jgi:putative transposase